MGRSSSAPISKRDRSEYLQSYFFIGIQESQTHHTTSSHKVLVFGSFLRVLPNQERWVDICLHLESLVLESQRVGGFVLHVQIVGAVDFLIVRNEIS